MTGKGQTMMRATVLLLSFLAVTGCMDTVVKTLGPQNDERVKVVPDTLRFQAEDMDNVHDTRVWSLSMSTVKAKVLHRTFVHHGIARITIQDNAGDTLYNRVLLQYDLDDVTLAGQAGTWTVTLELFGARGNVDFTIKNKP